MLDIRRLRTDPDAVRAGLSRRGGDAAANVDRILELDVQQRALGTERDDLRARIKVLSKEVGQRRGAGDVDGAEALMAESRALGEREKALDVDVERISA
jgi:seryl-tRNA synthetase